MTVNAKGSKRRTRAQASTQKMRGGELIVQVPPRRSERSGRRSPLKPAGRSPAASVSALEILTMGALLKSGLVGMWAHRKDLPDSPEFASWLRQQAECRGAPTP
jgi:hypothetical protein